jgi:hypothetical protein
LAKAMKQWRVRTLWQLKKYFVFSTVSKTDSVVIRNLDPKTGAEKREREIQIFINENQSLQDIVIDVAHEMVHGTTPSYWDPYDPDLNLQKYMFQIIDGPGGEVEAVFQECLVATQIGASGGHTDRNCGRYRNSEQVLTKDNILKDLYRVGEQKQYVQKHLGEKAAEFKFLSDEPPQFFSSTGNAPYPVALIEEYRTMTQIACQNTQRRIETIDDQSPFKAWLVNATLFLKNRCGS